MDDCIILSWDLRLSRTEMRTRRTKTPLARYYEQLRQSIVENGNYAEALLQTAHSVYTVDLTNDRLESVFIIRNQKNYF